MSRLTLWIAIWLGSLIDAIRTVNAEKFVAERIVMNFQRLMTMNDSYADSTQSSTQIEISHCV